MAACSSGVMGKYLGNLMPIWKWSRSRYVKFLFGRCS